MHLLRILLFLTVLAIALPAASAMAYIGLCCSKCGGNMPMNILGGGIPETCEFRLKVQPVYMKMKGLMDGTSSISPKGLLGDPNSGYYMAVPTEMDMWMVNLAVGYSFTERFFGGLMFMYKYNSMWMHFSPGMQTATGTNGFSMRSEGFGDTMLMTKYLLYADDPLIPTDEVSLLAGVSLPTGSIDEKNDNHPLGFRKNELLPYGMQLGSGTFDPILGVLYQASSSPLWWGADAAYTGRWYKNAHDYHLGDEVHLDLYGMFQFRYDMLVQLQLNSSYKGKIKGEMDEFSTCASGCAMPGVPGSPPMTPLWDPGNYGGQQVAVSVGFQWQPFPMQIVDLTAGIPVYQNLNGPQLAEDFRVMLTYYIELPTPSSIRFTGESKGGRSRLGF